VDSKQIRLRQKARKLALQALYQWDIARTELSSIEAQFVSHFDMSKVDTLYFHELLFNIPKYITEIDNLFVPKIDRQLSDLNVVERTILRMGSYEMAYRPEIPYKVVINESVALSKIFGAADSHKYINGVMDKVARQLRHNEIKRF
jgi:N utilization substance protein B